MLLSCLILRDLTLGLGERVGGVVAMHSHLVPAHPGELHCRWPGRVQL